MKKWAKTLIFLDGNIVCKDKCVNTIKKVKEKGKDYIFLARKNIFLYKIYRRSILSQYSIWQK